MNEEVAALLREYAELTQITGGDVFRVRNYEKAARSIGGWADDISALDAKALREIPGVGASIAAKIAEYRETGSIKALDELRARIPPGVLELTRVPGLGPKRALQLNRELSVGSVDDLAAAVTAGRLDELAGFGARSAERIAGGIEVYRQGRERVLLDVALRTATSMVAALTPISQRCAYAGSLRRWRETIGDIDILAAAEDSGPLMAAFSAGQDVVASGPAEDDDQDSQRPDGGPAGGAAGRLGRGAAVLHGFGRAQRGGAPDRDQAEAETIRIWTIRCGYRPAHRVPYRGGGLPAPRAGLGAAGDARGPRGGAGGGAGADTRPRSGK